MVPFRDLRPSSDAIRSPDAQASPTASSETGDGSRKLHHGNPGRVRKRRPPAHMSQNACTNCKRARAKCDGQEPGPCSRCFSRELGDQCHYEVNVKMAKEEMIRRIKSLEQQNAELQRSVREKDYLIKAIFEALKSNTCGPEALARLRSDQSYQELVAWLGASPFRDVSRLSPGSKSKLANILQEYEDSMRLDAGSQFPEGVNHVRWTFASHNLTNHLMNLFFTWVHPIHMLFSEQHFMRSFSEGDRRYCSPALVNMLCAMGCFYHVDRGGDDSQPKTLLKQFFERGLAEVANEDPKSLTFASTYAIVFLVELSSNQARKATSHIRLAVESLAMLDKTAYSEEAVALTARGIHTLSALWAALTYQMPVTALSPPNLMLNVVKMDKANSYWQPYRTFQDKATARVPSQAIATSEEMMKLGQIVYETVAIYCGRNESVTAHTVMYLYRRYLDWKKALPLPLSVTSDGVTLSDPLPHVLSLHIHFHVALCQLFRPLLEIEALPSTTRLLLYTITVESARDGLRLLERYRTLYHRYQNPLLAFCVVHICETLMRGGAVIEDDRQRVIQFALETKHECLANFAYVGPLQYMFCQTVLEEGLPLPKDLDKLMDGRTVYGPEEILDACERVSLNHPYSMLRGRTQGAGPNQWAIDGMPTSHSASTEAPRQDLK
ncbi:hypothetical protein B0J12DRAFT_674230 [Macrophomina phaseolina]|uniref:Zn(2)-C6 fungal-type domain-containing protein n=1 Tax=Macrophomina phaseolina TaxID=35725 RepID=A0ABQ8G1T5_9PEZI|nr:hypothetical protein B0J12DRAFT_674230 [Macrophomina phaseolina]